MVERESVPIEARQCRFACVYAFPASSLLTLESMAELSGSLPGQPFERYRSMIAGKTETVDGMCLAQSVGFTEERMLDR